MTRVPIKVAALATHPVFYQMPLYQRLASDPRIDFTTIFASTRGAQAFDGGFGQPITWDIDVLEGYRSIFLRRADGESKFRGFFAHCDPDIIPNLVRGRYEVLWIHGYSYLTHQMAAVTQIARRCPLFIREEQTLLHERPFWKSAIKAIALRGMFARASGLYVGSQNHRWFQHYGVPNDRLFFTPYVIDNRRFQEAAERLESQRSALRCKFGISDDAGPVILTVCRLVPKKQPLFLLEAFRRVREQQRCALLIAGSGELEGEIRRRIRDQAIPDVVLAGFLNQTEVPRAYACADIFVLASAFHETWGLVTNEAMNFGLPIVVSDKVGCAEDLVQQGDNGFIVPADDPQILADRLSALVADAELRARFGARSREIIDSWNYEVAANGILKAVEAAVGPERWLRASV